MNVYPKQELLGNPFFAEFSGVNPTVWSHTKTATTYSTLNHDDELSDPRRAVFATGIAPSRADYIFGANRGVRAVLTSAAVAENWAVRQAAGSSSGLTVTPGQKLMLRVVTRCNVDNNLLSVKVIGLVGTTDTYFLRVAGADAIVGPDDSTTIFTGRGRQQLEWSATSTDRVNTVMKTRWHGVGIPIPPFPATMATISVQIGNGTAGAQTIDPGEVSLREIGSYLGGAG